MELNDKEKQDIRTVLREIYGSSVDNWRITNKVFNLFVELIKKSEGCSSAFDLVPRPYRYGISRHQHIRRELGRIARNAVSKRSSHYVACMNSAALGMRTEFEMAAH